MVVRREVLSRRSVTLPWPGKERARGTACEVWLTL